jgi:hypothetical protein
MKSFLKASMLLIVFVAILYSCNTQPKIAAKPASTLITHKEAFDTIQLAAYDSLLIDSLNALPIAYTVLDTAVAKELMNKVDVTALLSSRYDGGRIYNGFFGEDNYRIEFYINKVDKDAGNPLLIRVAGKTRYKKQITPFVGTITLDKIYGFRDLSYDYQEFLQYHDSGDVYTMDTLQFSYHTRGSFVFAEDKNANGSGVFAGSFFMDFRKSDEQEVQDGYDKYYLKYQSDNDTRKSGLLMEGEWEDYAHSKKKHVLASQDLFIFANDILEDFSYGEREIEINKKYHALGWDNYWEAEEWWNDEGDNKAKAQL